MKIGVLVVAYNAGKTLVDVLERITPEMRALLAEVLVQDDHSVDDTHAVATDYAAAAARDQGEVLPITVVRHPHNLGYGGNQKAGYTYAINHGWDVVVLLHGDGQYAPEVMEQLIDPIVHGDADAVFGSRMMIDGAARAGGMPLYKYVGNRILTRFQNSTSGLHLSEWHSGYRAYRVSALAQLPFVTNSDGFDFDTEIILQLHGAGHKIAEVPIPTYYGDEICYVDGLRYARNVVRHTVRFKLGSSGFGGGQLASVGAPYAYKPSPFSSHGRVLQLLEGRPPQRILDVGCGPGWLAEALTALGHTVTGVDVAAHDGIESRMYRFVRADLEAGVPADVGDGFDLAIAADIIEHVRDPQRLLADIATHIRPTGTLIASVPNVSHWYPRTRVAVGRFGYDQRGILDATHLRFFTRRSFLRLASQAGLDEVRRAHTGLPLDALGVGDRRAVTATIGRVDRALVRAWPTMFAYQFVFELTPWRDGALRRDPHARR